MRGQISPPPKPYEQYVDRSNTINFFFIANSKIRRGATSGLQRTCLYHP